VAGWTLRRSKLVLARDSESVLLAIYLIGGTNDSEKVRLCPDVALNLQPLTPAQDGIEPPLPLEANCRLVGFNVSGLLYHGGYTRKNMFGLREDYRDIVLALLKRLLALQDTRVLLVPHMFRFGSWKIESDIHACRDLLNRLEPELRNRVHLAAGSYDQHQVKALIKVCHFFVGSRMHSCIAALSQGVPTVGIAYSRKFKGVFETIGVGDAALDAMQLRASEIIQRTEEMLAGAPEIAISLKRQVSEARAKTKLCFQKCLHPASADPQSRCTPSTMKIATVASVSGEEPPKILSQRGEGNIDLGLSQ
jgi:polysaccharide pyruvyl transferase WcaK-like protein